ncbi:Hypothetical predicted protein, partial [Scomber scombrus]
SCQPCFPALEPRSPSLPQLLAPASSLTLCLDRKCVCAGFTSQSHLRGITLTCGKNLPRARRKSQQARSDQAEVLSVHSEVLFQKQHDEMGGKFSTN